MLFVGRTPYWLKSTLAVATLLAGSSSVSGPAYAGAAGSYLQSAHNYERAGDLRAAEIQLRNAAQAEPGNASICLELAQVYLKLGNPNAAQAELYAARTRGARAEALAPLTAEVLFELGDFGNLLKNVPAGNRSAKIESVVRTFRGMAQLSLGETAEAWNSLSEAERLDPKATEPKIALARLFMAQQKVDEAERKVDEILAYSPRNTEAHELKGLVLVMRGKTDLAMQQFNAAIAADPHNMRALLDRANTEIGKGQQDRARADIKAAQAVTPGNAMAIVLTAQLDVMNGKFQDANALLNKLSGMMAKMPSIYLLDAEVKLKLNQIALAESDLNKLIAHLPNEPKAYQMLAMIASRRGDNDRAAAMLEHARQLAPKDVQILALLGQSYLSRGELGKAKEVFDQAVLLSPNDQRLQTAHAISQFATGDAQAAISQLSGIFKGGAGNLIAGPPLAFEALRSGRLDLAAATAEALVRRDPANLVNQQLLAIVRVAQHNYPAAEVILRSMLEKQPGQVTSRNNLAQVYMLMNRPSDARKLLQDGLQKNPSDAAMIQAFADFDMRTKNYPEALSLLQRAQNLAPRDSGAGLKMVALFEVQKNWSEALSRAKMLQAKFPDDPIVADTLGRVYRESGDQASSTKTFSAAATKFPKSAVILAHYARALTLEKEYSQALSLTTRAISLDPGNEVLKNDAVYLNFLTQGSDSAVRTAETFLAPGKPKEPFGVLVTTRILEQNGHRADAIALASKWQARSPSVELVTGIAAMRQREGDAAKGIALLEAWVTAHADDEAARYGLAQLYGAAGMNERAITQYEWLVAKQPDNAVILNNLAWLYSVKHDPRALTTAKKASALAPNSGAIADTLGWILIGFGDRTGALKNLRLASQSVPNDNTVQFHYAVALAQNGKADDARQIFEKILESNPGLTMTAQVKLALAKLGH